MSAGVARQLVISSRPVSWINTAYPFAAAYLLTTRQVDLVLIVGTVFFLVPYNLAMYGINDVFDYESTSAIRASGGAHGAVLDRRLHRTTPSGGRAQLPAVRRVPRRGRLTRVMGRAGPQPLLRGLLPPPLRLKERPVADSITSSIHFFSPAVYGPVLAGATWTWPLVAIIVAFALWGIASHAFGAVQDVVADREVGISSIATAFGAARTVRFALVAYALAGLVMLGTSWPGPLRRCSPCRTSRPCGPTAPCRMPRPPPPRAGGTASSG